jgi:hypothetical protein
MKKFMFSAVALIAFSFAGMANTGGEEKLNKEIYLLKTNNVETISLKKLNCQDFVFMMIDAIGEQYQNMTDTEAVTFANNMNNLCYILNQ